MKTSDFEQRSTIEPSEIRLLEEAGKPTKIVGYAAKFNTLSNTLGGENSRFREKIAPGAFADSIAAGDDVIACINHDPDQLIARSGGGTVKLKEDERGLFYEVTPGDTTRGRDTIEMVRRNDFKGMSFRFSRNAVDAWDRSGQEKVRTLKKVTLRDISFLTVPPAYNETSIGLRSLENVEAVSCNDPDFLEMREMKVAELAKMFGLSAEQITSIRAELPLSKDETAAKMETETRRRQLKLLELDSQQ